MSRLRFSIAQLMAIIFYLGFAFAALTNADYLWASATYTLAIVMISTALIGGLSRRGRARTIWLGFAVFGWSYLIITHFPDWPIGGLGAGPISNPILLLEYGSARLQPFINPLASMAGSDWVPYEQVSYSLGIILFGLIGAALGRLVSVGDDRPAP